MQSAAVNRDKPLLKQQFVIMLSCCLLGLYGCSSQVSLKQNQKPAKVTKQELTIAAASSLTEVMTEIDKHWQSNNSGVSTTYSFASSGTVQRQIEQGAPIDIFISADPQKIQTLIKKNLIHPDRNSRLLQNQIVVVSSKKSSSSLHLTNFNDLQEHKKVVAIAIGKPELVPAGKYAEQVLAHFKLTDDLQSKLVFAKDVRQVLSYVVTDNAEVGFVYLTDALAHSNDVKVALFPPTESYEPIYYAIAIIKDSRQPELAQEFSDFLQTPPAQKIFTEAGFIPIAK